MEMVLWQLRRITVDVPHHRAKHHLVGHHEGQVGVQLF